MTAITGTTVVSAEITPSDTRDTLATHLAKYGQGGFQAVSLLADLNTITSARREEGMWVNVLDADGLGNEEIWQLKGGILNANWEKVTFSSVGLTGDFTDLDDTPANYVGQATYKVVVNAAENGLEFTADTQAAFAFTDLTDTPASLGTTGQVAVVDVAGTALEFTDFPTGGLESWTPTTSESVALSQVDTVISQDTVITLDSGVSETFVTTTSNGGAAVANIGEIISLTTDGMKYGISLDFSSFTSNDGAVQVFFYDGNVITGDPQPTWGAGSYVSVSGSGAGRESDIGVGDIPEIWSDNQSQVVSGDALSGKIITFWISVLADGAGSYTVESGLIDESDSSTILSWTNTSTTVPTQVQPTIYVYEGTAISTFARSLNSIATGVSQFVGGSEIDPSSYPTGREDGQYYITGMIPEISSSVIGDVTNGSIVAFNAAGDLVSRTVTGDGDDFNYNANSTWGGANEFTGEVGFAGAIIDNIPLDNSGDSGTQLLSNHSYQWSFRTNGSTNSSVNLPNTQSGLVRQYVNLSTLGREDRTLTVNSSSDLYKDGVNVGTSFVINGGITFYKFQESPVDTGGGSYSLRWNIIDLTASGGSVGVSSLNDLSDVEISTLSDGQILQYDLTSEKFINVDDPTNLSLDNLPVLEDSFLTSENYSNSDEPSYRTTDAFINWQGATTKTTITGLSSNSKELVGLSKDLLIVAEDSIINAYVKVGSLWVNQPQTLAEDWDNIFKASSSDFYTFKYIVGSPTIRVLKRWSYSVQNGFVQIGNEFNFNFSTSQNGNGNFVSISQNKILFTDSSSDVIRLLSFDGQDFTLLSTLSFDTITGPRNALTVSTNEALISGPKDSSSEPDQLSNIVALNDGSLSVSKTQLKLLDGIMFQLNSNIFGSVDFNNDTVFLAKADNDDNGDLKEIEGTRTSLVTPVNSQVIVTLLGDDTIAIGGSTSSSIEIMKFGSYEDEVSFPQGTLSTPPVGLTIGQKWLDITDSVIHPTMRVALAAT